MKLIRNLTVLALSVVGFSAMSADAPAKKWSSYQELSSTYKLGATDGADGSYSGYLYSTLGYKADANNSIVAETLNPIQYTGGFDVSHAFLRIYLNQKNAFEVGGWKTALRWRWFVPSEAGTHQAGGLGKFGIRPEISREFGSFSLVLRDLLQAHLVRQQAQKYTVGGAAAKGVDLFTHAFSAIPSVKVTEKFGIDLELILSNVYNGKAGATKANWVNKLNWELYFGYDVKDIAGGALDSVTFSIDHSTTLADFKFYTRGAGYNIKLAKEF